jgi:hypothetical protein
VTTMTEEGPRNLLHQELSALSQCDDCGDSDDSCDSRRQCDSDASGRAVTMVTVMMTMVTTVQRGGGSVTGHHCYRGTCSPLSITPLHHLATTALFQCSSLLPLF